LLAAFFQNKLAPYETGVEVTQVLRPELANELRKKAEDLGLSCARTTVFLTTI
jgi:hypothetical protein